MERQQDIKNVEKNILENGLELVITSIIKHIAGDRCQVTFQAEIEIKIESDYFKNDVRNSPDVEKVKSLLGSSTVFRYSKVRNFIAVDEKERVFDELKNQFLENTLAYISSDSFPLSMIKRNYSIAAKEEELRLRREEYYKNS